MSDEATVQEDIAKDLYNMAAYFREEVNRLMQEFDKHDVNTHVELKTLLKPKGSAKYLDSKHQHQQHHGHRPKENTRKLTTRTTPKMKKRTLTLSQGTKENLHYLISCKTTQMTKKMKISMREGGLP